MSEIQSSPNAAGPLVVPVRRRRRWWLWGLLLVMMLSAGRFTRWSAHIRQQDVEFQQAMQAPGVTYRPPAVPTEWSMWKRAFYRIRRFLKLEEPGHTTVLLEGVQFDDEWFQQHSSALRRCEGLELLLSECSITNQTFVELSRWKNLTCLSFFGPSNSAEEQFESLTGFENVTSLSFSEENRITAETVEAIVRRGRIEWISLAAKDLDTRGVRALEQCQSLKHLSVEVANAETLQLLATMLPGNTVLNIQLDLSGLESGQAAPLLSALSQFGFVSVSNSSLLSAEEIQTIRDAGVNLTTY